MLNVNPLQTAQPQLTFKAPREWLPRLRVLIDTHPQDDLASTEALCCRVVGDFTAGIVLHRLLYWLPRGSRSDATIWKSDREWYAELNLSYAQMQRVRARLSPIIKSWVEKAQGAPTYHYQLHIDALIRGIATVLNCSSVEIKLSLLEKVENGFSGNSRMDFRETQESLTNQHQGIDERLKIYHPYLKRFVGFTPELAAKLIDQYTHLGESTVREILKRCQTSKGASWQYVLRALENTSTPDRTPIPLYDSPPRHEGLHPELTEGEGAGGEGLITDEMRQAWSSSEEKRSWDARLDAAKNPKPAALNKYAENWHRAYMRLEIQLDRSSFNTWLRGAHFLRHEAGVYHIGVPSAYIRDMLQHRMYRDIRRWVAEIADEPIELCFEVYKPDLLPTLLIEMQAAERDFYRKVKNG